MKKTKRYCISMDEKLHDLIEKTAKLMHMDFSSFLDFIARDKVAYFIRNSENYFMGEDYNPLDPKTIQWEKDIEEVRELAKHLWRR